MLLGQLDAPGFSGELCLEGIDCRPQTFQIDRQLLASLEFGDRRLQFTELFPPTPNIGNSLPNICLEVNQFTG